MSLIRIIFRHLRLLDVAGIAASTAALVSRLEELTGEGLDQHLKT